eukprot:CAMPEP_0184317204 /NCGR_PEP_ID=MMETSP1049-20130417/95225_1 /TAXON_ID=77928 /ORGANISM="Proteomonas sulcata, Strain CCMP704" /LENGTH=49 /DNA_ID=CAMNT_0026636509 /DNA_START=8 /DNA_END=157 /DNA_ORIENTATION=-
MSAAAAADLAGPVQHKALQHHVQQPESVQVLKSADTRDALSICGNICSA